MTDYSGKYSVQTLNSTEYVQWDEFISGHPSATLFHSSSWSQIISTVFDRDFEIKVIRKNNKIKAGLLYYPKSTFGIHAIPRVPITSYQGLLIQPPESQKTSSISAEEHELTNLILDEVCQQYKYIDLTLNSMTSDMRPYQWRNFKAEPIYTYAFKISEYQEMSKQFSQSLRRKINISSKEDHSIITSDKTDKFITFVIDSYRHHKLKPPVTPEKIEQLVHLCFEKKVGKLYYLQIDEKPVAALFVLYDQNRVYALFSGIDMNYRNAQYTEYLHAAVLQEPEYQGKMFDFLGANTRDFEQFKRSFGGQLQQGFRVVFYKNYITRLLLKLREQQHLLSRRTFGT